MISINTASGVRTYSHEETRGFLHSLVDTQYKKRTIEIKSSHELLESDLLFERAKLKQLTIDPNMSHLASFVRGRIENLEMMIKDCSSLEIALDKELKHAERLMIQWDAPSVCALVNLTVPLPSAAFYQVPRFTSVFFESPDGEDTLQFVYRGVDFTPEQIDERFAEQLVGLEQILIAKNQANYQSCNIDRKYCWMVLDRNH
jgi:hypothetical protein